MKKISVENFSENLRQKLSTKMSTKMLSDVLNDITLYSDEELTTLFLILLDEYPLIHKNETVKKLTYKKNLDQILKSDSRFLKIIRVIFSKYTKEQDEFEKEIETRIKKIKNPSIQRAKAMKWWNNLSDEKQTELSKKINRPKELPHHIIEQLWVAEFNFD
jgi:hypothetical protein